MNPDPHQIPLPRVGSRRLALPKAFAASLSLAVCSLLVTANLHGQQAATGQSQAKDEEILELSPFEVNADADVGYVAANTLSGTRLNTSLFDTPASISELTVEFLNDINADDISDAVKYSMGFEDFKAGGNDNVSQFNSGSPNVVARGLGRSNVVSRDYFPLNLNSDRFSTERISQSRGPNSILFGLGNAGGIINTSSKWARFRDAGQVQMKFDEYGSVRGTLDYNKKLTDTFAVRLNALGEDRRTWRDLEYTRSQRIHTAASWRPFERTLVRAQYERGVQDRLRGYRFVGRDMFTPWFDAGRLPYDRTTDGNSYPAGVQSVSNNPWIVLDESGQLTNWQRLGRSRSNIAPGGGTFKIQDETYIPSTAQLTGPAGTSDNDSTLYTITVQQEVLRNLFVELGYNGANQFRNTRRPMVHSEVAVSVDPNVTLPDGSPNPNYGQYYIEGQAVDNLQEFEWRNWRATVAYEWDTGNKWLGSHRWAGLATGALDTNWNREQREVNLTPLRPTGGPALYSNAQNNIRRRTYLSQNGVFGDNGVRSYNQDPYDTPPPAPVAFTDSANNLNGTITPGFYTRNINDRRNDNRAVMVAGQSRFLKDHLIVTYGWRRDTLDAQTEVIAKNDDTNEVTGTELGPVAEFAGNTRTIGAVVPFTRSFALYANKSDNFTPQAQVDLFGGQLGNVKGEGHDLGFKVSLLGDKLYARAGYYKAATTNQQILVFNETTWAADIWEAIEGVGGPHFSQFDASGNRYDSTDDEVEGYEFEITANPVRGLSLMVNFATLEGAAANIEPRVRGYVAEFRDVWAANAALVIPSNPNVTVGDRLAQFDESVQQAALGEGNLARGNYKTSINGFARYRFQEGALKGWGAGLGGRYRTERVLAFSADGEPIYSGGRLLVDAHLAYRRRIFDRIDMTIQLNVSNLTDKTDLIVTRTTIDGVPDDYVLEEPRTFSLSTTFDF